MQDVTGEEVTAMVRKLAEKHGGAIKLASKLDVTPEYIGHVLAGKKPGPKICRAIGVVEGEKAWVKV